MVSGYSRLVVDAPRARAQGREIGNAPLKGVTEVADLIRQDVLRDIATAAAQVLAARAANRDQAWTIFKDAFNAVIPGFMPDALPAAAPAPPAPAPAPAAPAAPAAAGP